MIFIDSTIPMYLVGVDHPHKRDAQIFLEKLIGEKARLVTNLEVFQEILHRYTAINRKDAIQPAFDALYGFVDEVFTIQEEDVLKAKEFVLAYQGPSARDALHAAHMHRLKIKTILTFDRGFDLFPDIKRIPST